MENLRLPKIGLGTYRLKSKLCKDVVLQAINIGYRLIDTAQYYLNEEEIGAAVSENTINREKLIIATKVWHTSLSFSKVLESTELSLQKLQSEYIDILYVHWPYETYDPQETFHAFNQLYEQGKIKNIAVSNFNEEQIYVAKKYSKTPIIINQVEHHPLLKQLSLRAYLKENNIQLIAYFHLAQGYVLKVKELIEIAKKYEVTPIELSLAWIIYHGAIPIPKASSYEHLKKNFDAKDLILKSGDIKSIDSLQTEQKEINYKGK